MSELEQTTSLTTPAPEPATPAPPADAPVDGAVDVPGKGHMAPVGAVIEERRARQALKAERDRLATELETARKKAENWDAVEPFVPLLATHPKVTGKPAPAAPTNQPDPELVEIAETWGFYDAEGQLDLRRAQNARNYMQRTGKGVVDEAVRPVQQTALESRAEMLRDRAYALRDKDGRLMASRQAIDQVLNRAPLESRANPEFVAGALLMARGLSGPAAAEPVFTEGSQAGGRHNPAPISDIERAAMKTRGISEAQWLKDRDDDSNVLE